VISGLFSRVIILTWALWLGGLMGIFLSVTTVFAALDPDRSTAGLLGAAIFGRAERLILLVAAVSLVASLGLVASGKRLSRVLLISLLAAASGLAVLSTTLITPRINAMRTENRTASPEFRRMHGLSMATYSGQAAVLALAGLLLPAAIRRTDMSKSSKAEGSG
jgi:hypothetical protein